MPLLPKTRPVARPVPWSACMLVAAIALTGCKAIHQADLTPLSHAGMDFSSIEQLRQLRLSDNEVAQVVPARQAGVTDAACIELVRIERARNQPFTDGQEVAGLLGAGFSQDSVIELARLNELGLWAGEAEVLRLLPLSDQVILDIAQRRAAGQPVLSGAKVGELKNAGFSEAQILSDINKGTTDEQADKIMADRNHATAEHGFLRERRRRR